VAGYRLLVRNLQPGSAQAVDTFALTTAGGAAAFGAEFISNVANYTLGLTAGGTYYQPSGAAPSDGNPPTQADYLGSELLRTGFYALDSVDLFNIMALPGDGIGNETEWQAVRAAAAPLTSPCLPEGSRIRHMVSASFPSITPSAPTLWISGGWHRFCSRYPR
jgi:hypothetical protein